MPDGYDRLLDENFITTGSVVARRSALLALGGFAADLRLVEDLDLWLRQAQRFPVAIEFDAAEAERLGRVRPGGQAEVMVYTGDNVAMNLLGAAYIRLMTLLSYLY